MIAIDAVLPTLKANSQKQALQMITEQAGADTGLPPKWLMGRLQNWENRAPCSGIGGGIAILQLTTARLNTSYIQFARLPQAIDYNAVDRMPVDLICLLLSPKTDGPVHLQRLARLSRLLRNPDLCRTLRSTDSADAIRALLTGVAGQRLAA